MEQQVGSYWALLPKHIEAELNSSTKSFRYYSQNIVLREHFLKVIKISHNSFYFLHLGQEYTISAELIFLFPLKANLLLDVQVWQLQTLVPSTSTILEEDLSLSIKVLTLFQSYNVINSDIDDIQTYIHHFTK